MEVVVAGGSVEDVKVREGHETNGTLRRGLVVGSEEVLDLVNELVEHRRPSQVPARVEELRVEVTELLLCHTPRVPEFNSGQILGVRAWQRHFERDGDVARLRVPCGSWVKDHRDHALSISVKDCE